MTALNDLPPSALTDEVLIRALAEDLGQGDITTDLCVPADTMGSAELRTRSTVTLAGLSVFTRVFALVDASVACTELAKDGAAYVSGTTLARVVGRAQSILKAERVALNFIQRMTGIATQTAGLVAELPQDSRTRITDTRKTTPGLRLFERYAVRCGGGYNHRDNLSSAVLIKDNHIAACGSLSAAVTRAIKGAPHTMKIEVEVDRMDQIDEALAAGAHIIMLDNFADDTLTEAVAKIGGRALVEVSGNVTKDRVAKIANAGVSIISVGGLTHSVKSADLGLDWVKADQSETVDS